MIESMRKEEKKKADLYAITYAAENPLNSQSSPPDTSFHQADKVEIEEELYLDSGEPVHTIILSQAPTVQTRSPEQPDQDSEEPVSTAILVVQLASEEKPPHQNSSVLQGDPPFQQFLTNLTERGVARKFYLSTTLEHDFEHEALLDRGADITLISSIGYAQRHANPIET